MEGKKLRKEAREGKKEGSRGIKEKGMNETEEAA